MMCIAPCPRPRRPPLKRTSTRAFCKANKKGFSRCIMSACSASTSGLQLQSSRERPSWNFWPGRPTPTGTPGPRSHRKSTMGFCGNIGIEETGRKKIANSLSEPPRGTRKAQTRKRAAARRSARLASRKCRTPRLQNPHQRSPKTHTPPDNLLRKQTRQKRQDTQDHKSGTRSATTMLGPIIPLLASNAAQRSSSKTLAVTDCGPTSA